MKRTLLIAALLLTVSPVAAADAVFRNPLPPSLQLPPERAKPLEVDAGELPAWATTGDAISGALAIRGGKPPYEVKLEGASVPPLATASPDGFGGTWTAGSFEFRARVTDSSEPEKSIVTDGWNVDVADMPAIGAFASLRTVDVGVTSFFDLPTVAGGTGPFAFSVSPAGVGAAVSDGRLQVLIPTAETRNFTLRAVDAHGRPATTPFSITALDPAVPVTQTDDRYISSVSGGSRVKGASNLIHATASGKSGATESRPAARISVGDTITVAYDRLVKANRAYMTFHAPTSAKCNSGTPQYQYALGQPKFRIETSVDGVEWHNHPVGAYYDWPNPLCGWTGNSIPLEASARTFKYMRLTLNSATNQQGSAIAMDVITFRAQ